VVGVRPGYILLDRRVAVSLIFMMTSFCSFEPRIGNSKLSAAAADLWPIAVHRLSVFFVPDNIIMYDNTVSFQKGFVSSNSLLLI